MKCVMNYVAPKPISAAYFILFYVCMCIYLMFPRQLLGKHFPGAENTHKNRRIVDHIFFSMVRLISKDNLYIPFLWQATAR
jgi:protein-S-isoprenylcysteine O-methyltransferase Ste14